MKPPQAFHAQSRTDVAHTLRACSVPAMVYSCALGPRAQIWYRHGRWTAPTLLALAGSSVPQKQALWLQGLHGQFQLFPEARTQTAFVQITQGPFPGCCSWRLGQAASQLPCVLASLQGTGCTLQLVMHLQGAAIKTMANKPLGSFHSADLSVFLN